MSTTHTPFLCVFSSADWSSSSSQQDHWCVAGIARGVALGVHITANRCSGHRPSSLAMTPRVWWILSVLSRSCGPPLSTATVLCSWAVIRWVNKASRVGISYMTNLYSTVWSKKRCFHYSLLFAMFLNSPVYKSYLTSYLVKSQHNNIQTSGGVLFSLIGFCSWSFF